MLNKRVVNFFSLSLLLIICTLNPPQKALAEASSSSGMLDIDGNGSYDALTDGLLILRYLFGLSGDSLIAGVVANNANYATSPELTSRLDMLGAQLDVDGNGSKDALTDGLMILRYLFGIRGDLLISDVLGSGATRGTVEEVELQLNSLTTPLLTDNLVGTGSFKFTDQATLKNAEIDIFYHIPQINSVTTPIVFVFHGGSRNPRTHRDSLVSKADELGFIVMAPGLPSSLFPGGDGYNLGNVFVDGDNPSAGTLNDEPDWAFSIVEPLFDHVKQQLGSQVAEYSVFGHSAGGQFTHRLLFFKPNARISKMVASASGWYTTVDESIMFPYGFRSSPLEGIDLPSLLAKNLTVLVGENDNDPNADNLRRNSIADLQGTNRLSRAQFFHDQAQAKATDLGVPFNWKLVVNENTGHQLNPAVDRAMDLIFN
jgi:pimeloyl-ACP methyl ester carboxylesterase|tara:strand:+ start:444 stop:1727 length:1284 start_codon:yes stop_codon:yes gene_type:complete